MVIAVASESRRASRELQHPNNLECVSVLPVRSTSNFEVTHDGYRVALDVRLVGIYELIQHVVPSRYTHTALNFHTSFSTLLLDWPCFKSLLLIILRKR